MAISVSKPTGFGSALAILLVLVCAGGSLLLLTWSAGRDPDPGNRAFAQSAGYQIWAAVASVVLSTWLVLAVVGIRENSRFDDSPTHMKLVDYIVFFVIYLVIAGTLTLLFNLPFTIDERPPIPLAWWELGRFIFTIAGLAVALPWVIIVWRIPRMLHHCRSLGVAHCNPSLERREELWGMLEKSLASLIVISLSGTVAVATIRWAAVAQRPASAGRGPFVHPSDYPAALPYISGSFSLLMVALLSLPAIVEWRRLPELRADVAAPSA